MEDVSVIVSTTSLSLWENKVPEVVFTEMRKHFQNVNSKQRHLIDTYVSRDDPRLVSCFQLFYGKSLENCQYATIRSFHSRYVNHYKILQQPCYLSCVYPEEVYLDKKAWIKSQENEEFSQKLVENDEVF